MSLSPTLYMMIGLPGSGKSHWVQEYLEKLRNSDGTDNIIFPIIASTDDYIENIAKRNCKTYNQMFKELIKEAQKECHAEVRYAIAHDKDCIWDQTNLTQKSRMKKLDRFPDYYKKVAVVVSCTDHNEWMRRINNRPGKIISLSILDSMAKSFEYPMPSEGFDEYVEIFN